jgi:hypothetical protein
MGGIYSRWGGSPSQAWGGLEHLDGWPAVHMASQPTLSVVTDFERHQPSPLTSLDTCMKWFLKICQTLTGRPRHPLVSYCLWHCLILDIMKIFMDLSPYDAFRSSDVPEMVNQQNSWKSLVINTYLLYLEWNLGMLAVDMCILWPPTYAMPCNACYARLFLVRLFLYAR